MASRHSMDLTHGSVFKKLIVFAIPILLTNLLQAFYHAADVIVVGNFALDSKTALAAVGSSGAVTALLLNLFLGLSMGANVVCANFYGAHDREGLQKSMQTSMILATFCGLFVGAIGFFFAGPILTAMGVPESVLPDAITYMRIIFLGQPGSLVYNFGAGILRSHGDTKRPMYILMFSGFINVVLNLVFVAVFHLDSAGVALATTISHYISATIVLYLLSSPHGEQRLDLFHLHFYCDMASKIAKIGIPGGLNGIVFNISNVIIARAVFQLGDVVVAGNSAAGSLTDLVFQVLASLYAACVSFSGQNYGAKKFKRIDRLLWQSILLSMVLLLLISTVLNLFSHFFLRLYTPDEAVIEVGAVRLLIVSFSYVLYSVSEMAIGCLRGMGKSVVPTVLNAVMICVPRILWVWFVFPQFPTFGVLYLCYGVSYIFSGVAQMICYLYYSKKDKAAYAASLVEKESEALTT